MEYIRKFVEKYTFRTTWVSPASGIGFTMDLPAFKWIKTESMTLDHPDREANMFGIEFLDNNAKKDMIGVLGEYYGEPGIEAAGLYGEHL